MKISFVCSQWFLLSSETTASRVRTSRVRTNKTSIEFISVYNREVKIPRFRFTGTSIAILFTNFADVSNFTRNFYPFPRGKPWSTRKRQTGTGVFCLLFLGRLNRRTNFQHLTQINNTHMLVKVFNNLWRTSTAKVAIL